MASDRWPIVSRPSNFTEPVRRSTMPMTDFKVVVLPAPFRPSSVTSSPLPISKPTPCRMCDSPYQACRPSTFSNVSGMAGPDIGFDDLRVLRHRRVGSFRQHLAARQHGDGVGQVRDDAHIVLDHEDGAVLGNGANQRGDAPDILLP